MKRSKISVAEFLALQRESFSSSFLHTNNSADYDKEYIMKEFDRASAKALDILNKKV